MAWYDDLGEFASDAFDQVVDGYVAIETTQQETSTPQIPASVGVTEPVQTTTTTPQETVLSSNQLVSGVDNVVLVGAGFGCLLLIVIAMKR